MTRLSGAEIIVDYLIKEEVPYVFALCGHGNVGLLDVLLDHQDLIRVVSVHHESVAAFMADAYFRVTHRPVAVLTSCGPGATNLPVALASAFMDSSALLAITGNVPTTQFNRGPFQETGRYYQADFPSVLRPYVKRSFQTTRVEQLPVALRQAFSLMLNGRPGPVHLDVPLDVFIERADVDVPDPHDWRHGVSCDMAASETDIRRILAELRSASRPLLLVGHGVELAGGCAELAAFAQLTGIPVAHTPLAKGCFDPRSNLSLGETGRNGTLPANRATRNADVILALGTRLDDRTASSWLPGYTFSIPPTRLIQVDIDPAELGRNYPLALGVVASSRVVLAQLREELLRRSTELDHTRTGNHWDPWLTEITESRQEWELLAGSQGTSDASPMRPERLLQDLRATLPEDAVVLADVGAHHNWMVQRWPAYLPSTFLQSWGFASMGFGVAGALGAKLASPSRPVVSVVGDGGFLMFPSVVATAVQYDLPVVWIVWNNGGYISIRDIQRGYLGSEREFVTSFFHGPDQRPYSADYAAMARAMGAVGMAVERPQDFAAQLRAALATGRPCVLDVPVDREAQLVATATWELPPLPHPEPAAEMELR